jgi:hypothetical protein
MKKAGQVLLAVLLVLAVSAGVGWIAGPEAGGTALLMISIGLGAYFGAGWGGDHATKVEGYRRELLSRKGLSDAQTNPDVTGTEEEK